MFRSGFVFSRLSLIDVEKLHHELYFKPLYKILRPLVQTSYYKCTEILNSVIDTATSIVSI